MQPILDFRDQAHAKFLNELSIFMNLYQQAKN